MGRVLRVIPGAPLLCLLAALAAAQATDLRVGELADLDRITFEGNATFDEQSILRGLSHDRAFLLSCRPTAPRVPFLDQLANRVLAGYHHAGFHAATVHVKVERDPLRVTVRIGEGPRLVTGKLIIAGFPVELEQRVRRRLTTPWSHPADQRRAKPRTVPPLWAPDKPAHFDRESRAFYVNAVRESLDRAGYLGSPFTARVTANEDGRSADLRVELDELGPRATLGKVEIRGECRTATRDAIRDYLGLRVGMPLDRDLVDRIRRRLYESGRFTEHRVEIGTPDERGTTSLGLTLVESEWAPPLATTPTPAETWLLRTADWLDRIESTGLDLIADWRTQTSKGEVVWSPQRGCFVRFEVAAGGESGIRSGRLVISRDRTLVVLEANGVERVVQTDPLPNLTPRLAVLLSESGEERPFALRMALGSSADPLHPMHMPDLVTVHPGPILYLHGGEYAERDETIEVARDGMRLTIDRATGVPRSFEVRTPEAPSAMSIRTGSGCFDRRIRETLARLPGSNKPAAEKGDWAVLLSGLVIEQVLIPARAKALGKPEIGPRAGAAVQRIVAALLPHFRTEMSKLYPAKGPGPEFTVPRSPGAPSPPTSESTPWPGLEPGIGFGVAKIFPRDTWPAIFTRETLHTLAGHRAGVQAELERMLERRRIGPIGCLVGASLPGLFLVDRRAFAGRGLESLEVADFRRDYELLLFATEVSGVSRAVGVILRALRDVEPIDTRALAEICGPYAGRLLLECHAALREAPKEANLAKTLRPPLNRAWETWLRKCVKTSLEELNH